LLFLTNKKNTMKRLLFLSSAILLLCTSSRAQKRLVLYEEFTSETCAPSRGVDTVLWALLNSGTNPDNIQLITFSEPYPSAGLLYNTDIPDYSARNYYYAIPFVSYGLLDGKVHDTNSYGPGLPGHLTQDTLDAEVARPAPFNVTADYSYDITGTYMYINVHITCVADYAPPGAHIKIYAASISTLDYVTAPGGNGLTHFENMVRKMYPSPGGSLIDSIWVAGDTLTYSIIGMVHHEDLTTHPHTATPEQLVVWVQNDHDKDVLQVARAVPSWSVLQVNKGVASYPLVNIYPNPAADRTTVSFEMSKPGAASLLVSDAAGRIVYSAGGQYGTGSQKIVVPTGNLPNGIYCVKLQTVDNDFNRVLNVVR
jgi:Secretion system C-terminal sorting domain